MKNIEVASIDSSLSSQKCNLATVVQKLIANYNDVPTAMVILNPKSHMQTKDASVYSIA
jgi:hypothetical protein